MYDLIKLINPIKLNVIKRYNKAKKWDYGYNKEHDVIVISKTGAIGDIVEIQKGDINEDLKKFGLQQICSLTELEIKDFIV